MHARIWTILILTLASSQGAFCQIEKGDKYLGISGLPIAWLNNGNAEFYGFITRAYFGKHMTDKLSLGLQPYYARLDNVRTLGGNIYGRYRLNTKQTSLFLEGSTGLGAIFYSNSSDTNSLISITIGPGLSYSIKESILIDLMFQYQTWTVLGQEGTSYSFVPSIGAIFYLKK